MPLPDDRLERILFVTQRFGELRGLAPASIGAFLILGVVSWSLLPADSRNVFQHVAFVGVMGALWAISGWENFYDRRFGQAPLRSSSKDDPRPVKPDTIGALLMQMALGIDMIRGFMHPGGGSVAAATLVGYALWVLVRDWRYRPYYVVGLAAGVAGLVITWGVPLGLRVNSFRDPAVAAPYVVTFALVGFALVVVGLLDHRLLAGAIRPAVDLTRRAVWLPDMAASRVRAMVAGTSLIVLVAYLAVAGWPQQAQWLYWSLSLTLMMLALMIQRRALKDLRSRARRAEAERARMREERLAEKVAALRGESTERLEIEPPLTPGPPPFDPAGHMILPIAMAAGALADVMLRGAGVPSLFASALAASHLRIALRDWPTRKHYLLGTLAASISAVHFMFVSQPQVLDWTVWFLILMCTAMLVEGLLDLHVARTGGEEHLSKEHHADAI